MLFRVLLQQNFKWGGGGKRIANPNDGKRGFLALLVWWNCLLLNAWEQTETQGCPVVREVPATPTMRAATQWLDVHLTVSPAGKPQCYLPPEVRGSSCNHPCGSKALMYHSCVWPHYRSQLALGPQLQGTSAIAGDRHLKGKQIFPSGIWSY